MEILRPHVLELPRWLTVRLSKALVQRLTFLRVRTIRLVHIERKEVHPSLIECIVDLRYHSLELHLCRIQIPERSWAEFVIQKTRRSDQVYIWVFGRVNAL